MITALSRTVVFCHSASGTSVNVPVDVVNVWPICAGHEQMASHD